MSRHWWIGCAFPIWGQDRRCTNYDWHFFVVIALALGELGFSLLTIIPQSVLGVLLVFAGLELCPLLRSLKTNEEYFIALLIAGIALAVPNMGWAFGVGIATDIFIRKMKIKI